MVVRGEARDGNSVVESAQAMIDYVPAQSKSSGAIIFAADPGENAVWVGAVGYSDP